MVLRSGCGLTKYVSQAALTLRSSCICYNLWKFKVLSGLKIMGKRRKGSERGKGHDEREEEEEGK